MNNKNSIIQKNWHDETAFVSYIEGLHFPPDRIWENCKVKISGTNFLQAFEIIISENGNELETEHFTLKRNETKIISRHVNKECALSISGKLERPPQLSVEGAGGRIDVECSYDNEAKLQTETVSWEDDTCDISCIENLFLNGDRLWKKCEIFIQGRKDKMTGCMTTLIANGEIVTPITPWIELNGTESKTFVYDINKRVPLLLAGYITNNGTIGAAKITLTGYY